MSDERELQRHNKIIEQINNAKKREDLPNVSFSTIASFLATNVYFDNRKISQILFKPVVDKIIIYGSINHPKVKNEFIKVIKENYSIGNEQEIIDKYNKISNSKRIGYVLNEINCKNEKLDKINKEENLQNHEDNMRTIQIALEVKDLPKVGVGELNRRLVRAINDNDFNTNIKASEITQLTNAYLKGYSDYDKDRIIEEICQLQDLTLDEKILLKEQIINAILMDETIGYIIEEIFAKEKRKLFIYGYEHQLTMEAIKQARRISQLPPNLTFSTLTSYLNGNTTIYTNDNRIKAEDLKTLTQLLLDGYKWEDDVITVEINKIVSIRYPDKEDAANLLLNKLSKLPKTYYFVEEINYSLTRQKEFIGNRCSNVNVYFIPNSKSPIDGGRFYNCYINRVDNLDLSQILPLNLDEIVPPKMDIDSIEWYVQEYFDDTFKAAGGIILNKDETIGNVNVFRPNDGKVGVSIEEKEKLSKIEDLDKQIVERQERLDRVVEQVKIKEEQTVKVEDKIRKIIVAYEKKMLSLQMEMLKSIENLKQGLDVIEENENSNRKVLK